MSAEDNLSHQLFRGVMKPQIKQPLGIHWSLVSGLPGDDPGLGASLFANPAEGEKHAIVHGRVNPRSVVSGHDTEFYEEHQILDTGAPEFEEPVYPGSKVAVDKVTKLRNVNGKVKTRNINYKPPRVMKA